MRADRLIRLILLLGDGRRRTASALAEQLEVSERTVLRDVDALELAGIPVTTSRGPDGGVALPRAWARYVAGLTADEVAGLAALGVPAALGGIALDQAAETALGKVLAALPAVQRAQAEAARQRLLVDPSPWWAESAPPACLDALREAVLTEREVRLGYAGAERVIRPLGLVVKGDRWYVLADTDAGRRTFRGDRIAGAELLDRRFARDPDFDLRVAWKEVKAGFFASRPAYPVTLALTERGRAALAAMRPAAERAAIGADPAVVDFQQEDIAVGQLVLLGAEAKVLAPSALVERLGAVAAAWTAPPPPAPARPRRPHPDDGATIWCGRMPIERDPARPHAVHDFAVVGLHLGERVRIEQDGTWEAAAGDLQLIPAGARHGFASAERGEVLAVRFCPGCLRAEGLGALLAPFEKVRRGRAPLLALPPEVAERLRAVLTLLEAECAREGPASARIRQSLLEVVLEEIGRLGVGAEPDQPSIVGEALAWLEVHALEPLTLAQVAAALGRSPAHLTTALRQATGKTVFQWIVALRMAEARRRLRDTDEYVEIVGERVGYPDPGHFGRVFRREHGVSPARWRSLNARRP